MNEVGTKVKKTFEDTIEDNAIIMAELMFKMEKACRLKEELFCSKTGISPMELRCLRELLENRFPSIRELSAKMDLTPSRITHIINGLEKKKLLERRIDEDDRRVIKVSLSDNGKTFAQKIMKDYIRFHLEIINLIEKNELNQMLSCLQRFLNSVTYFINNNKSLNNKNSSVGD